MMIRYLAPCLVTTLSLAFLSPAAYAEVPKVVGKTYGEWSAKWWQWAFSIPQAEDDPVSGVGAVDCALGQQGPVYFLAGLPAKFEDLPPGFNEFTGERECTVPHGKALFFPFVNATFLNEPDEQTCLDGPLGGPCTVDEKRELLDFNIVGARFFCGAAATIDGVPPYELATVRTQSPPFLASPVDNNSFNVAPGTYDPEALSDGFWMMVPPLSQGDHTVTLRGAFCNADDPDDPNSPLIPFVAFKMTYDLTVGKSR
jgi:hypothetical protein